ncbi:MAG: gfo/Idh/MocA family oxidoreductase, partial [Alphaproteobacteria bacterium]
MTDAFPAPARPLRLGLVGGGRGLIGRVHANGARLSGRWTLVAGALSSRPELAAELAAAWQIDPSRSYADWQEMARAEAAREDGVDAVAIVTPNNLHAPVARAFMERGIDVICEKPLAPTLDDARDLAHAARKAGVIFGVTYPYAAHAMVRQARAMVARGMLGEIRQVHVEYFQEWAIDVGDSDARTRWRLDPAVNGPSLTLADIGTHAEHLVRFVTGRDIDAVSAAFHVTGAPKSLEDTAFAQMRLAGDVPATLMVSQAFAGTHCGLRIRVAGSQASLDWNAETPEFLDFRPVRAPAQRLSRGHGAGILPEAERLVRMPRGHPEALTDAWANLYLEFGVAIDARRRGLELEPGLLQHPTLEDGLKGLCFVDAAV